jgi:hypothetical protein
VLEEQLGRLEAVAVQTKIHERYTGDADVHAPAMNSFPAPGRISNVLEQQRIARAFSECGSQ